MVIVGLLAGCVATSPDEEVAGTSSQALEGETSAPDPASPSEVTLEFSIGPGVHDLDTSKALNLVATNHANRSIEAEITLRIRGLGVTRTVELAKFSLDAGQARSVPWSIGTTPIAPTGSSASVLALVHYDSGEHRLAIPAEPMTFAFDKTMQRAFVSTNDDLGVRLASLGRARSDGASKLSADDRAAVLAELDIHRGRRDGLLVNESSAQVASRVPSSEGSSDEGDVVPLPGDLPAMSEASNEPPGAGPAGLDPLPLPGPIQICLLSSHINTKTGKYCANWQPQGFRDVAVSSSVVPEDFTGEGPAAYANAVAKSGSTVVWQGRLDASGCTPTIEFCNDVEHLDISTASLQNLGAGFLVTTRDFRISPAFTYAASPSLRYSIAYPPYDARIIFNIQSGAPTVRVASIVSRILKMADNGVVTDSIFSPPPPLNIHTENGCQGTYYNPPYPSNFSYIDPITGQLKYGEACAGANDAWFGQVLSLQGSASTGYTYVPTSWHTTQDAVTVGHELGHSAQYSMNGGPGSTGYDDKPTTGDCSCDWVASGNRTHCLQSRHNMASAEVEGFGHFYAARIMNDVAPGADARFTYYKTYLLKLFGYNFPAPPPFPLSISSPASGQGWVRAWCPASNKSAEYDWLTFLWAVNGKAATNRRATMTDIFTIFRNASGNFIWQNIRQQAFNRFGDPFDPRYQEFDAQLASNGLKL